MEYDSESSCESRLRDLESAENPLHLTDRQQIDHLPYSSNSTLWHSLQVASTQPKLKLGTANKSLSAQVMEYYEKHSQSANLDQYFSLPKSNTSPEAVKHYYSIYELNPKLSVSRQDCIEEEYHLKSYIPKERRKWVRPPLIGQSSSSETSSRYVQPLIDPQSPSPDLKRVTPETIPEEKNESQEILIESADGKALSPTSSIASHKPLEWDSGADLGYFNTLPHNRQNNTKLSTIERMALVRGCSTALRLDPEGTTESSISGKVMTKVTTVQSNSKSSTMPNANSTPVVGNVSGSESEVEITPIMKNHLPGIITGSEIKSVEKYTFKEKDVKEQDITDQSFKYKEQITHTPKSSFTFKIPAVKYPTEGRKVAAKQNILKENLCPSTLPLKKSTSMNMLVPSPTKSPLKRCQSEFNINARDKNKALLPLIFNSTSSIATVVNKPATCDKVIQTSFPMHTQESIGVQVSVIDEEKPPLPKRGTSLQKTLHSILKNPSSTYKVESLKKPNGSQKAVESNRSESIKENKVQHSNSEISGNDSASVTPLPEEVENITGRTNSFEYFPGHIYENVPNGNDSHVSSSDTGRSNSTLPNTSSSINEKLWGDSDSLVRDLERSVNILRSLVDANKCDKQVKKRLIRHVVKRLVTAKYTDDKIEHNLEDNVPWNPDDARNKVYRTEILQALAKKHSSTDSSDEWKPQKKGNCVQKSMGNGRDIMKEVTLDSSNSDKFDRNTDRTEMDGRKARMGLRTDDCQHTSNSPTDRDKSESSECFFPQRSHKNSKAKNIFCLKEKCKLLHTELGTANNSSPDQNRLLLDAVVKNRTNMASSNNTENNIDWRLPTTLSERRFELKKCSTSDSGDSKLVSYAEMEKRNQLIWITNEISHLCNLKKLLQQPRRLERVKSSPRKSKSANFKSKPMDVLMCMHGQSGDTDYTHRDASHIRRNSIDEQWSSHCNLATCQPATNAIHNVVHRVKKRNSCAQTAINTENAHSRTGGEIISASKTQSATTIKLIDTGVQTLSEDTSPSPTLTQSETVHYVKCPTHKTLMHFQSNCKCTGQTPQCQKHTIQNLQNICVHCFQGKNHPNQAIPCQKVQNLDYFKEGRPIILQETSPTHISSNSINSSDPAYCYAEKTSGQFKQKETKNQINATKSKYTCDCNGTYASQCVLTCRCKMNSIENKQTECNTLLSNTCQLCSKQTVVVETNKTVYKCEQCQERAPCGSDDKEDDVQKCACANTCESESERLEAKRTPMKSHSRYHQEKNGYASSRNDQKEKSYKCTNDCICDSKREKEVYSPRVSCDCHPNERVENDEAYQFECRSKEERPPQVRPSLINGQESEGSQKHKVQNSLRCNCDKDCSCPNKVKRSENKAYSRSHNGKPNRVSESSADSDRSCKYCRTCGTVYQTVKKCGCHQAYPKAVAYELSFAKEDNQKNDATNISILPKVPLNSPPVNGTKSDGCVCDMTKRSSGSKGSYERKTLQDYLSKNKPEFVGNAEMRRQYMFEISHLRQLRKEKRVQLLAMASTSNTIKSPKPSRSTVCAQRKITDEEMKERLRKRYLRLNEVRLKRRQQERQEEARRNKLMAKIFCKKLQQKVLRGQVDLSQSVSVISNL